MTWWPASLEISFKMCLAEPCKQDETVNRLDLYISFYGFPCDGVRSCEKEETSGAVLTVCSSQFCGCRVLDPVKKKEPQMLCQLSVLYVRVDCSHGS